VKKYTVVIVLTVTVMDIGEPNPSQRHSCCCWVPVYVSLSSKDSLSQAPF